MKAYEQLPTGYRLHERIDLVKNRRQLIFVNALSIVLAVVTLLIGLWLQPEAQPSDALRLFEQAAAGFAGVAVYIAGHEAVHGVLMWLISRRKPRFGFKLMYAYAGSTAYFDKAAYLLIAIAPLAVWTVVLSVLAAALPPVCFWPVWAVQIMNISGAAGDLYVFFHLLNHPRSTLVQDDGTAMTVWHAV